MNRETKVGLIVGFALVLVVGILISDHVAATRRPGLADLTRPAADGQSQEQDQPRQGPASGRREVARTVPLSNGSAPPRPTPVILRQGSQQPTDPQPGAAEPGRDGPSDAVPDGFVPVPDGLAGAERPGPVLPLRQSERDRPRNPGREGSTPALPLLPGGDGASRLDAAPVPHRTHTVTKDESLWKIAERYLGNGAKWRDIAQANPGKVTSDGGVREGVTLVIPGAGPDATPPTRPISPDPAPATPASDAGIRTAPDGSRRYVIAKGEVLSLVAQRLLGSAKRVEDILALNPEIDDPDDIWAGMEITLPSR